MDEIKYRILKQLENLKDIQRRRLILKKQEEEVLESIKCLERLKQKLEE